MPINRRESNADISEMLDAAYEATLTTLENLLVEVGKACMDDVIRNKGYQDRTGNLNDSCGFAVARDGRMVYQSLFKQSEGGRRGEGLTQELATKSSGIALFVVAGEAYAEFVEATGRNVISSAEILAEKLAETLLRKL